MISLYGMAVSGIAFVAFATDYFWPIRAPIQQPSTSIQPQQQLGSAQPSRSDLYIHFSDRQKSVAGLLTTVKERAAIAINDMAQNQMPAIQLIRRTKSYRQALNEIFRIAKEDFPELVFSPMLTYPHAVIAVSRAGDEHIQTESEKHQYRMFCANHDIELRNVELIEQAYSAKVNAARAGIRDSIIAMR